MHDHAVLDGDHVAIRKSSSVPRKPVHTSDRSRLLQLVRKQKRTLWVAAVEFGVVQLWVRLTAQQ